MIDDSHATSLFFPLTVIAGIAGNIAFKQQPRQAKTKVTFSLTIFYRMMRSLYARHQKYKTRIIGPAHCSEYIQHSPGHKDVPHRYRYENSKEKTEMNRHFVSHDKFIHIHSLLSVVALLWKGVKPVSLLSPKPVL
jgi:hypothetical protein